MRAFMDSSTAMLIYQSMIIPILTYCSLSLYGSTPAHIKRKVFSLEDHAQKIIGNRCSIPCSEELIRKQICMTVHKCMYDTNMCSHFKNLFNLKYNSKNTRNNGTKIEVPKIKLEAARASFFYQGAILFNNLPKDLRVESDFSKFKVLLRI